MIDPYRVADPLPPPNREAQTGLDPYGWDWEIPLDYVAPAGEDSIGMAFLRGLWDGLAAGTSDVAFGLTYDGDAGTPRSNAYDLGLVVGGELDLLGAPVE